MCNAPTQSQTILIFPKINSHFQESINMATGLCCLTQNFWWIRHRPSKNKWDSLKRKGTWKNSKKSKNYFFRLTVSVNNIKRG